MNYLSHLFFSQGTPDSLTGNLMADFKPKPEQLLLLPSGIHKGIANHRLVDRLTDSADEFKAARHLFSKERRRFAGIILDISFDYFLIKHWHLFATSDFEDFKVQAYGGLLARRSMMPPRMQTVVTNMHAADWLAAYGNLDGIAHSIDAVSRRMRFSNSLAGAIDEVERNYAAIEDTFAAVFEKLLQEVFFTAIEGGIPAHVESSTV